MKTGQLLFIGNQESSMNFKDNWYPFRQDSTLLYYTGIDIPNVHLLIDIESDQEILFGNELSIDDVVWTGPLPALQEIAERAGIQSVRPLAQLAQSIVKEVQYLPPYRPEHTLLISKLTGLDINEVQNKSSLSLVKSIIAQRNIKEDREIEQMKDAVRFSYDMHKAVMKASREGILESDLVGVASKIAYEHEVRFSYPAILTKRGEVLHNHDHCGRLQNDDMVLYDGGCESKMHYAGDITRTFPVNGKWESLQKEMYDIVYDAYNQCLEALRPGIPFRDVHLLACKVLSRGLKDLGFMKGDIESAVHEGAHTLFFQCGLGHMIGLDVHDMENLGELHVGYGENMEKSSEFGLKSLRLGRALETGFTITVEPGIYIIPTLIDLRRSQGMYTDFINYEQLEQYKHFGGIRLEDNFLITEDGSELLAHDHLAPRTSEEIEDFMP